LEGKHLYRFGEFNLCVEERNLRRGDRNIPLTPKMYDLLLVLVQNPDRIVEKEFLLRSVWPDSFVEEGNISFNIRQLRKALGDSAQEPMYIETIPRRGYRFVAKVENVSARDLCEIDAVAAEPVESVVPDTVARTRWVRARPVLAVGAFAMLLAVMGSVLWLSRGTVAHGAPILSAPFAMEKLSTDGMVFHAVLTPDGKTMVYTHRNGRKQSLWLRQLETSNNIQIIPPTENFYGGLAVSPDAATVYFTRGARPPGANQLDIYRLPLVGGVPQKLAEATQGWISLSSDGEKISYVRCPYKDDEFCSLWIADAADGKNERKLISRPRPLRIADNKISPDGRKIAFASGQSWNGSNEFTFMEVDIETGAERELTPQKFFNINYIAWLPDQSGLLVTALKMPDKSYRIWHVSAANGEATMLTADSETYSRLSLDAAARTLVSTRIEPDFKLNIYQTDDAAALPRELSDGTSVAFAPDQKIFYSTTMTGDQEVWSINADGTDQRQLTNSPGGDSAPIVSPDNRSVFFASNRSGEVQVWRMAPDGSNQTQVTTQEGGYPLRVSPDGQWVYYRSGLHNTLRRAPLLGGQEEVVLSSPGVDFALAPDTAHIALTRRQNNQYIFEIVSLGDSRIEKTFAPPDPAMRPAYVVWSHDGADLVYVLEDEGRENRSLWFQSMTEPKPRKIADLGATEIFELAGFALSYDAKHFVVAQGNWNHDAVLIKGLKP